MMFGVCPVAVGGAPAGASTGTGFERHVVIVGDSLVVGATDELRWLFAATGFTDVDVVAMSGSTIGWSAQQAAARPGADIVVMAAGTNNEPGGWTDSDVAEARAGIAQLTRHDCGVWILPATVRYPMGRPAYTEPTALATVAGIRRLTGAAGVPSAPWAGVADAHPDWYGWDGVHHNDDGKLAYASYILGSVTTHCNPAPRRGDATDYARFVDAAFRTFLGRPASSSELTAWTDRLVGGQQPSVLTDMLSTSSEWVDRQVIELYARVLDRTPDAAGLAYWHEMVIAGARLTGIGASFYASDEFFRRSGGTNRDFITELYRQILGREPDAAGLQGWEAEMRAGATRLIVSDSFYAGIESRRQRVTTLYHEVLRRSPDAGGLDYWAGALLRFDDVVLASHLAASQEFFALAQRLA